MSIMGVELVDYAGGDNPRVTIAVPFVRVKPELTDRSVIKKMSKKNPEGQSGLILVLSSFLGG